MWCKRQTVSDCRVSLTDGNVQDLLFRPQALAFLTLRSRVGMAASLVGEKCSHTESMLRFFAFSRLALEQNF